MKYLKVDWKHTFPNDPLELFMELDAEDMEIRKVHVYPDGHRERADTTLPDKDTWLAYEPTPPLDEINSDPQFEGRWITKEEFEEEWNKTRQQKGR
ncbi:hypothetical protein MK632_14770 [Rhizobium changzhiense]|uniref:DUF6881 domain-containing protein n=1 Tax=Rhizobium changzhiense TaxID=2692317 RepID=UPI001F0BB8B4|nr:hypothetical protein [Rhizobium changzhiense]MCH4547030.1 hypothetical protein [Rhizobium changzhiense]